MNRRTAIWLVGGGLAIALLVGGGRLARATLRERAIWPRVLAAARRHGVDAALLMAIARHESSLNTRAAATDPRDLARGGSYGLVQMSLATARALGYRGTTEGLYDPDVNLELGARGLAAEARRIGSADPRDLAAVHNSGRPYARAPRSTREEYVPRVMAFYADYRRRIG